MGLVSPLRLVGRPLSKMSLSRKKYHTEREKRKAGEAAFWTSSAPRAFI
jgi:hypothetical protein